MTYYGNPQQLEYDISLAPGADPNAVRMEYSGAESLLVGSNGDLLIQTKAGQLAQHRPRAFQEIGGRRVEVEVAYRLSGRNSTTFAVARYDKARALLIDPVLAYSTFLGGTGGDAGAGIAVDSSGNAYITGRAGSIDFPTANPYQPANAGGASDVFVAKLSPDGGTRLYTTYLGGSAADAGNGIAVDSAGSAYVVGQTGSTNFPMMGPVQGSFGGFFDGFITKLSPAGNSLVYSSFLGGSASDQAGAVAVDSTGNAYVAGFTFSADFPTLNPYQGSLRGTENAFVVKINPTGTAKVYSTYLGGNSSDYASGIAIDSVGNAYIAGTTISTNFPLANALFLTLTGSSDAFITELNANGNALVYSTYLGGSSLDAATGIAVDSGNNAVVSGYTSSTNFPTANAFQNSNAGGLYDAFVTKINSTGSALVYSTYLGGTGTDQATAVALDAAGNVFLTGKSGPGFPLQNPLYSSGGVFVAMLSQSGSSLLYSTYLAGNSADTGAAIASGAGARVFVSGVTTSTSFPSLNGVQPAYPGGSSSGFVTALSTPATPSADSATPSSGSGLSQTFALQYSDTGGAANLSSTWASFSATVTSTNSCLVQYVRSANTLYLMNDAGTQWMTGTPGVAGTLQNGQCSVNVGATTISLNGNILVLNLPLTFTQAYAGAKTIYLWASDVGGSNTSWQSRGSWTVPGVSGIPSADSVAPSSGSGMSQSFALQYSDTAGALNLNSTWASFGATVTAVNSCLVQYIRSTNTLYLMNDAGTQWTTATLGAAGLLQNSQCSISVSGATASLSGNSMVLNLPLTFTSAFAGAKTIALWASDMGGGNTSWQNRGTWTVPGLAGTPSVDSVTPASGSGLSQTFALQYSDTAGALSLNSIWASFSATVVAGNSCMVQYIRSANTLYLMNDAGTQWLTATPGVPGSLQNSQCSINVGGTTISLNANSMVLHLPLTFPQTYAGAKSIFLWASDIGGSNTGWQTRGSWTIPGAVGTPSADSVVPGSGSGMSQSFALQYSDTAGALNLNSTWASFGATVTAVNSCMVQYIRSSNTLYLMNDAGTQWTTATLGAAGTLQNSQCSINTGSTSVSLSGNSMVLNLPLTFTSAFAGAKTIFLWASDIGGDNTGWQNRGTWTVPGVAGAASADSVSPSSGAGLSQTFALQYSDTAGATNLNSTWASFSVAVTTANSCLVQYVRSANTLYLMNDAGTQWTAATPGLPGTLQNSQCSINVGNTTILPGGNIMFINLPLTFAPAYAGAKSIFLWASDIGGTNTGWQTRGSWTVQ